MESEDLMMSNEFEVQFAPVGVRDLSSHPHPFIWDFLLL